jgi:hypothetical protein
MTRPCFVGYIYILDRPTGFSDCGPTSSYLVRLRSNKKTTLAVTSATCRHHSPHSPPLLEAYRWKGATYYRTIFIHTASLNLPLIDYFPTTDIGTLVNMAGRLRPSLPGDCPWFGQEDLKVVGAHPIDAGGFADVWVGEMGDRKVAIKSYRCHASANSRADLWGE